MTTTLCVCASPSDMRHLLESEAAAAAAAATAGPWQREDGLCDAALLEVFSWLEARALCAAGGVCRAWRRAAAAPPLWRRLLTRALPAAAGRALRAAVASDQAQAFESWSWRDEYVRTFAGWERTSGVAPAATGVRYAALTPSADRLALLCEHAEIAIWQRSADGAWHERWRAELRSRGWRGAEHASWADAAADAAVDAAAGSRLLVAGPLHFSDLWELLVFQFDESGEGQVRARARCGPGAAGCWAGAGGLAFLSLEPRLFAPRLAATAVRLNAATQEIDSEFAGVTSTLFWIFNEDHAHITLVAVAEVPEDADCQPSSVAKSAGDMEAVCQPSSAAELAGDMEAICQSSSAAELAGDKDDNNGYLQAILTQYTVGLELTSWLVALSGVHETGAVRTWRLHEARPAPVVALETGGSLAVRVQRARAAPPASVAPAPPPPSAAAVRAACRPPHTHRALPAPPLGLALHPSGRCAWVSLEGGGAWCVSLPLLRALRRVHAPRDIPLGAPAPPLHYVGPSVSDLYFASPAGAWSGACGVWGARGGAVCPAERAPRHAAAATMALLAQPAPADSDRRAMLIVLAGNSLHVWRSRATRQPLPT